MNSQVISLENLITQFQSNDIKSDFSQDPYSRTLSCESINRYADYPEVISTESYGEAYFAQEASIASMEADHTFFMVDLAVNSQLTSMEEAPPETGDKTTDNDTSKDDSKSDDKSSSKKKPGALKRFWDAIVRGIKAIGKAIANFFRRIKEFFTGKKGKKTDEKLKNADKEVDDKKVDDVGEVDVPSEVVDGEDIGDKIDKSSKLIEEANVIQEKETSEIIQMTEKATPKNINGVETMVMSDGRKLADAIAALSESNKARLDEIENQVLELLGIAEDTKKNSDKNSKQIQKTRSSLGIVRVTLKEVKSKFTKTCKDFSDPKIGSKLTKVMDKTHDNVKSTEKAVEKAEKKVKEDAKVVSAMNNIAKGRQRIAKLSGKIFTTFQAKKNAIVSTFSKVSDNNELSEDEDNERRHKNAMANADKKITDNSKKTDTDRHKNAMANADKPTSLNTKTLRMIDHFFLIILLYLTTYK